MRRPTTAHRQPGGGTNDVGHVEGVRRIAVVRPNAIGDFVFTLPALTALRDAYPHSRITYLGKHWHRTFLQGRPGPWDDIIEVPEIAGVGAPPEADHDEAEVHAFLAGMRDERFDIAIQIYGGGRYANPFTKALGARLTVGLCTPDAEPLDRSLPYQLWRNERLRYLEIVSLIGAPATDLSPTLALIPEDEAALRAALGQAGIPAPLVVLQPGARDPRRRWPIERFAELGNRLTEAGAHIAINGSEAETALTGELAHCLKAPALDLGGKLGVPALTALLSKACLLVSNDTGPLHLAQALGTPTVGIFWFMNLLTAQPLVMGPHREFVSLQTRCPVCGADNAHVRCPHDVSFVADVAVDDVADAALQTLSQRTASER